MTTTLENALPIDRLTTCQSDKNPNKMTPEEFALLVEAIRASDDGSGIALQPILAAPLQHGGWEVVDGAHRVAAAKEIGWTHITAVVREMTAQQISAYRLMMNRNRGRIDLGIASAIVTALHFDGWSAADMIVTGFSADEITDLVHSQVDGDAERQLVADAGATRVEDDEPASAKPFVLEIAFASRADYTLAKRKLRKAAGKSKSLSAGLLAVLGEEAAK